MAPGVRPLSGLQLGVETTAGTPVNPTRELYPGGLGFFNPGVLVQRNDGAQRGTFTNVTMGTVVGYAPTIGFSSDTSTGLAFDEIPIIISQLNAGETGTGAGADKTWSTVAGGTTATFDTYTLQAFDATQCYEIDYGFATNFSISWGFDDLTQWSMDWVGRQSAKVTVDAVAANNAVKIPSGNWGIKYATSAAGLTGASFLDTTMRAGTISVELPQIPRRYAGRTLEFGRGVASRNLSGTVELTWDSESDAVTQYDRFVSQSVSFFRFSNAGPTLGSSTYSVQIDVAVLWDPVMPLSGDSDGVNEYTLTGHLTYDSTWGSSIGIDAVCSIASLP
jgi:hypothetical protein